MKLYGVARSRATRNIWLARELGIDLERVAVMQAYRLEANGIDPLGPDAPFNTRTPEFLTIAPSGAVPVLEDGDLVIFESLAINHYLADKVGGIMAAQDAGERASVEQWALYGMTAIEPHALDIMMIHAQGRAGTDEGIAELARHHAALMRPMAVLNAHLARKGQMLGDRFTVADIDMAEIIRYAAYDAALMERFEAVSHWLAACQARPAFIAMMAERAAEPA
jgi:glutathione S-transferase